MKNVVVEWKMQQGWLPAPEPGLQPATVCVGWSPAALLVEAELGDLDIYNPVENFNEVAFTRGDVFEIFVRPEWQAAYYEIHITPHNQLLQLRYPSADAIRNLYANPTGDDPINRYKVWQPRIASTVEIDRVKQRWIVRATLPFAMIVESGEMKPGSRWLCSFCRYDYTRGQEQPVLSSTSRHIQCDYHRQEEWQFIEYPGH